MATERTPPESAINSWNAEYIDTMYQQWLSDPESVAESWQQFFRGFDLGARSAAGPALRAGSESHDSERRGTSGDADALIAALRKQGKVDALIYHYRDIGHLIADLDPLGTKRPFPKSLELESFGLHESDLDALFDVGLLPLERPSTLRAIIDMLQQTYCGHVGVEYMHMQDREQRRWLQAYMEPVRNRPQFTHEQKMHLLRELIEADALESFLHRRYMGKKRFGLDGGEALIPMLDALIDRGPLRNVKEFTIGMAHRGRLNVLVNILHKTYDQLFTEFEEAWVEDFIESGGDVKYHRGYSADHTTSGGEPVRLTLSPNPSHLEYVNAVVLGRARAKQRIRRDMNREQCVPILMHGDASFPAQGVVAECLNMVHLDGYTVGGTIHVVINNQVGFTTDPKDAHSGRYCTDIAKMIEAPIFHVNGDDPEACAFVAQLALDYRQAFKNDIVIDFWCFRKHGHNEGDEPTYTQPLLYERIRKQEPVLTKYAAQLVAEGEITQDEFERGYERLRSALDEAQTRTKEKPVEPTVRALSNTWAGLKMEYSDEPVETAAPKDQLVKVSKALAKMPDGFNLHKKLKKLMDYRGSAVEKDEPLDWAMGEMLAYGTLLDDGFAVRLTGQDVERGTFSHRHAVLFDQKTGKGFEPLNNLASGQSKFCIHNSPLTESACVGFEYGYSLGDPKMLVIWEAQFGDFVNGAQVYFDQFVASAEAKWKRSSGMTCFLPHGYEGQGPEHSSARLERFLILCANNNMAVVYPTTPAQMFHMLRRQMKRAFRKPLIVMTPKSLLRHPEATSSVAELTSGGGFQRVIDDPFVKNPARKRRVLLCTGKIYYDLIAHRRNVTDADVAIIRVEELYPFPEMPLREVLKRYPAEAEMVWAQEEPRNMGAYRFMREQLQDKLDIEVHYIGREVHASPAVASQKMHEQQQKSIMVSAIGLEDKEEEKDSPQRRGGRREEQNGQEKSDKKSSVSAPSAPLR
jgi:2-oxoglutarate dehydrogenase E1 component